MITSDIQGGQINQGRSNAVEFIPKKIYAFAFVGVMHAYLNKTLTLG